MPKFVAEPSSVVEEILNENGYRVEVDIQGMRGRPGDVYEARIEQKIEAENFAVVVYESGSIDTDHDLLLVNKRDRVVACIKSHLVSTPAIYRGKIEIGQLEEEGEVVKIKYRVGVGCKNPKEFEAKYTLKAKTETSTKIVSDLQVV